MLSNDYIIKVNGSYFSGEQEDSIPTPRYGEGWYVNRTESTVLIFMDDISHAKVIGGLLNLNSYWQRIYNAMRYDGMKVDKIEIERII